MTEHSPASLAARARLTDDQESWIALARYGGNFTHYSVCNLLRGTDRSGVRFEARYWIIISALTRDDIEAVRIFINDWSKPRTKKTVDVWKWTPGDHFYVYDRKFDTLDEAVAAIRSRGDLYGRFYERFVYPTEGG